MSPSIPLGCTSNVKSYTVTATGWRAYPGQQYHLADLPRSDLKSFTRTVDYATKSAKSDYVRVQGNNPPRGGGAGFPVQGEPRFQELVNGNIAWNLNAQGEPARQAADVAGDRQLGRNEPCPCRSGKKFKHCCAKATLH